MTLITYFECDRCKTQSPTEMETVKINQIDSVHLCKPCKSNLDEVIRRYLEEDN